MNPSLSTCAERIRSLIPLVFDTWTVPDLTIDQMKAGRDYVSTLDFITHCLKTANTAIVKSMKTSKNLDKDPYILTACITNLFPDPTYGLLVEQGSKIHQNNPHQGSFKDLPSSEFADLLLDYSEAYPPALYRFFWRFLVECLKLTPEQLLPTVGHTHHHGDSIIYLHHRLKLQTGPIVITT